MQCNIDHLDEIFVSTLNMHVVHISVKTRNGLLISTKPSNRYIEEAVPTVLVEAWAQDPEPSCKAVRVFPLVRERREVWMRCELRQ